jgi:DNA-binding XRE family transcriptional regulator
MKTAKKKKNKATSNALEIIDALFIKGKPEMERLVAIERTNAAIGRQIYSLRTKARLTQSQLAERVGTTASVISRLEDSDYDGHSMSMLQRIAAALKQRVEVRFVKLAKRPA